MLCCLEENVAITSKNPIVVGDGILLVMVRILNSYEGNFFLVYRNLAPISCRICRIIIQKPSRQCVCGAIKVMAEKIKIKMQEILRPRVNNIAVGRGWFLQVTGPML